MPFKSVILLMDKIRNRHVRGCGSAAGAGVLRQKKFLTFRGISKFSKQFGYIKPT